MVAGPHEQADTFDLQDRKRVAYNEAHKRRGSLAIWFDPAMMWQAAPTGKRGRRAACDDAAIQTCLTMTVLFGMALRRQAA